MKKKKNPFITPSEKELQKLYSHLLFSCCAQKGALDKAFVELHKVEHKLKKRSKKETIKYLWKR